MSHFSMKEVQEEKKAEPVSYPFCSEICDRSVIFFSESVRLFSDGRVVTEKPAFHGERAEDLCSVDAIEINLESQEGTEFPRVHKGPYGVYLALNKEYDVKIEFVDGGRFIGNVQKNSGDGYPLPKGTKTKIIVTNHPDPEKRFTVTIEEPEDWLPLNTSNSILVERGVTGIKMTTPNIQKGGDSYLYCSAKHLVEFRDVLNRVIAENEAKCSS